MRDLNPGERAEVDRWLALTRDIEHAWPYNAHLYNDEWCERAIRERIEQLWQGLRADRAYLLGPDGRATLINTDRDDIRVVARATLPHPGCSCDRCGVQPPPLGLSVALVAAPRHIVALALCGLCAADTDPDDLIRVEESS